MSCASRRLYRIVPSGSVTSPHGMSVSVPTCCTAQIALPHAAPVVTVVVALRGETLPWPSRASTAYGVGRSTARGPLSTNVVAGGTVAVPVTVPTLAPPR